MTTRGETGEVLTLQPFPLQLADTYLYESSVTRVQTPGATSTDEPTAEAFARSWHIQENARVLVVVIGARVSVTFRDGHVLKIECTTAGHFRSEKKLTRVSVQEFAASAALLLIYPYLRANIGELARTTGIRVPPLPTLDAAGVMAALSGRGGGESAPRKRRAPRQQKLLAPADLTSP